MAISEGQPKDPLHGVTLERIVKSLVNQFGWDELGRRVDIRCFKNDPSVRSSLKFLRRIPWARKKVENLYIISQNKSDGGKQGERTIADEYDPTQ